ncbi:ABC transporter permease [Companilactobacillus nodensis]|uniref:ABC transporter permease n=1 Tax=Companilactobacillus nodensis DSM 19682 = JCM 14932 = NBRC 107160 TaxID=1423775 RepID=A0A0R1K4Q0_9LACO|nr:ABC transporter permease subunit [Companilactobacillus nodensis]KRK78590.1 ABC transporter permease [Companilactobacillus nodensis DSM 19682 = JCM 14932 = NBRC 107160]
MRATWFFIRKELLESWRSYHLLIIAVVFVIFGIEGPLMAKLTPEILKMASGSGMTIKMTDPTSLDSWQQYYKNMTQIGIYVLAVIFSGTISGEVSRGTLINLVTKGLPRYSVVLAKYIVAYFQWCLALVTAFFINWVYTAYYFSDNKSPNVLTGLWPLLIFGSMFVAVTIFGSALGKSNYLGFLTAVVAFIFLTLLNLFKDVKRYNPISLVTDNMSLVKGTEKISHIMPAVWITILSAVVLVYLAVLLLKHKKL